jgi:ABC-type amino acid transport substrate-binding protein
MSLNEGKVDLFVSAVGANVPAPNMAGVAYSIPYLSNGGIAGIAKRPEVIDRVRDSLHALGEGLHAREQALAGLTIAVQEGTAAHAYAMAELKASRMIVVDSLPAAFESDDPKVKVDVILGSYPVLKFVTARTRKDWQLIMLEPGKPFILTKEHYAIVMPEQSYKLRWLVNKLLLRLEETGRLQDLHRRWFDENYAYPSRALSEGLPFLTGHVVQAHDPARPVDHVAPRGKAEPRTN